MKLFFDFLPLILFFAAYYASNLLAATAMAIVATLLMTGWSYFRTGKVERMQLISLAIIVVLGGATLITRNSTFIMWKPTVFYWCVALVLGMGMWGFKKNFLLHVLGAQIQLPPKAWSVLTISWVCFFAAMGAINLWVAFTFSEAIWVNFKVFGGIGLLLVFAIAQALYMSRYLEETPLPEGHDTKPDAQDPAGKAPH